MIWMHRIAEVALPMFRRADADAYGADEPWLFPDLGGKEPISPGIRLTVGNGLFDSRSGVQRDQDPADPLGRAIAQRQDRLGRAEIPFNEPRRRPHSCGPAATTNVHGRTPPGTELASRRQAKNALHYADIGINTYLQVTRA
jgi:hypothetical protein